MFSYVWPLGLVVLSNVFYQICAKTVPDEGAFFREIARKY